MSDCVYPCPCGYFQSDTRPCTCAHALVTKYQKRISGPLLDRIDIHIEVPRVDYEKLSGDRVGESSESIRARVQAAWNIQTKRYSPVRTMSNIRTSSTELSNIVCNADMRVGEIRQDCKLQDECQRLMRAAMSQLILPQDDDRVKKNPSSALILCRFKFCTLSPF
jgi:magnesium chelatase family protein